MKTFISVLSLGFTTFALSSTAQAGITHGGYPAGMIHCDGDSIAVLGRNVGPDTGKFCVKFGNLKVNGTGKLNLNTIINGNLKDREIDLTRINADKFDDKATATDQLIIALLNKEVDEFESQLGKFIGSVASCVDKMDDQNKCTDQENEKISKTLFDMMLHHGNYNGVEMAMSLSGRVLGKFQYSQQGEKTSIGNSDSGRYYTFNTISVNFDGADQLSLSQIFKQVGIQSLKCQQLSGEGKEKSISSCVVGLKPAAAPLKN